MPWFEVADLLTRAQAAALRGDGETVRAAVALVPVSQLRGGLVVLLEAWAAALTGRHADPAAVGRLLAEEFETGGGGS